MEVTEVRPLLVDLDGLSKLVGLSPSYLAHAHGSLGIPSVKLGRRRLWPIAAVEEWISKRLDEEAVKSATTGAEEVAHG